MKWFMILLVLLVSCAPKPVVEEKEVVDFSEAAKLGKPMKCTSQHEGQTTAIYIKGSQMRMDTMPSDAHGIYTADMMYTWRGAEGMTMKMEDVKKLASEQGQSFTPPTQEQLVAKAQQENAKCESFDVPESMFVPPENVKFEDLGELMRQIEATTKNLQK